MMKTLKIFTLIAALSTLMFSCSNNEDANLALDALKEAVNEPSSFTLAESDFTIETVAPLDGVYDDMYTDGVLQYSKNGVVLATVEFGNGTDANMARLIRDGEVTDIALDLPFDGRHPHACFRLVFPLTYIMPDGSAITGNSRLEIHTAFREWYAAHPDATGHPELQFPVELQYRNQDETVTVNSYVELRRAYAQCGDRPPHDCRGRRFIKRVVEPLVRTDDCGREPVSGVVKFFHCRTHEWIFTIDFGDGACDDLATKITADGITTFVISEHFGG